MSMNEERPDWRRHQTRRKANKNPRRKVVSKELRGSLAGFKTHSFIFTMHLECGHSVNRCRSDARAKACACEECGKALNSEAET